MPERRSLSLIQADPLPIKVIPPLAEDYSSATKSGGAPRVFRPVDDQFRNQLSLQFEGVTDHFRQSFRQNPGLPVVFKLNLIEGAEAKSYHPINLIDKSQCEVVGSEALGELFVSGSERSIRALQRDVLENVTKKGQADLSTILKVEPYTASDALPPTILEDLSERIRLSRIPIRLRLFTYSSQSLNGQLTLAFEEMVSTLDVEEYRELNYAPGMRVMRLTGASADDLGRLSKFAGTQSLAPFPKFRPFRPASLKLGQLSNVLLSPPASDKTYGTVMLVDSGIDRSNSGLIPWVQSSVDGVPPDRQDTTHGTFVAGLIAGARQLNRDNRFPASQAKIVDLPVFDQQEELREDELIAALDSALTTQPEVRVYNLSLGSSDPTSLQEISYLGAALDARSAEHNVIFVIASGNFESSIVREFPPQQDFQELDRIGAPADALLSITVGSVAHKENSNSGVKTHQPSPFSRKGPGFSHSFKPELVHYGGNCDYSGGYQNLGVISLGPNNQYAEDVGTSYAAPLVSALMADTINELETSTTAVPNVQFAKSLVLHGTFVKNGVPDPYTLYYKGLGIPAGIEEILECSTAQVTIAISVPIQTNPSYVKRPFPIPINSLRTQQGKLSGEIYMTLLYAPIFDQAFQQEYCRSDVKARLGTVNSRGDFEPRVPLISRTNKSLHETELVKDAGKWSPLKFYHADLGNLQANMNWELRLDLLHRNQVLRGTSQDVHLIITIKAPHEEINIADEMIQSMNSLNWGATDLQIKSRTRLRG